MQKLVCDVSCKLVEEGSADGGALKAKRTLAGKRLVLKAMPPNVALAAAEVCALPARHRPCAPRTHLSYYKLPQQAVKRRFILLVTISLPRLSGRLARSLALSVSLSLSRCR